MTNRKTTKRALISCLLALLICCTMLVGTTFAWFTDSETISGNKITAGTLDLVVSENNVLATVDVLWEPGYSAPFDFALTNAGSLWLKYELAIANLHYGETTDAEEKETEFAGLTSNITEVLDVYTGTAVDENNYLGTVAELFEQGNFGDADNEAIAGLLGPKGAETDELSFVIKMKEEAGNEYQGDWCTFDIVAKATQHTYEEDGFGSNQYDANATFGIPVATEAELAAALGAGKDVVVTEPIAIDAPITVTGDVTIELQADLDASALAGGRPFDMEDGSSLIIDAGDQNVKVSDLGLVNIAGAADVTVNGGNFVGNITNGAFIKVRNTATDVNVTLNNVTYTDEAKDSFIFNMDGFGGTAKINVYGGTYTAKVGVQVEKADVVVKGATINTKGVAFEVFNSNALIDNCTINVDPGEQVANAPSAYVAVSNNGYAKVINSTFTGNVAAAYYVYNSGGQIEAANNTVPADAVLTKIDKAGSSITVDGKVYVG